MRTRSVIAGRCMAGAALLGAIWLIAQVALVSAAGPETYALPEVLSQQLPTPTPFRFLTPSPLSPGTTPAGTTTTAPRAGGFPVELALPVLAGGLAAIGGGSFLLRRKRTS